MNNAIMMGIFWHLIGAASAACFYAPFKQVKHWSWETMWSVGGIVSWIILPWTISAMLLPDFWAYFSSFSLSTLAPVFLFGARWGIGNINYGLTMRYLGMSMGIGIAIGITLIVGTLMTPMAANFNIVPAALLELKDKYQVIKIQIPTALTLLVVNVFLMYFLVFR